MNHLHIIRFISQHSVIMKAIMLNKRKLPDAKTIAKLYFEKGMSCQKIAKLYGCHPSTVFLKLKHHGYKLRKWGEVRHIQLTRELLEFLTGHLLGDGSLSFCCPRKRKQGKSAMFHFVSKYFEYIMWTAEQLSLFGVKVSPIYSEISSTGGIVYRLRSKCYREFAELKHKWYPYGKKEVPRDLNLSPNVLKYWYLDDGTYRVRRNGRCEEVSLCSKADPNTKLFLVGRLHEIGIEATARREGITIRKRSQRRFFQYMLSDDPFIPRCFLYKFPNYIIEKQNIKLDAFF